MYHVLGLFFILYELNTLYNLTLHRQLVKDAADDKTFDEKLRATLATNPKKALWMALTMIGAFLYWIWLIGGIFTVQMPFYALFLVWTFLYGMTSHDSKIDSSVSIAFIIFVALNAAFFQYKPF